MCLLSIRGGIWKRYCDSKSMIWTTVLHVQLLHQCLTPLLSDLCFPLFGVRLGTHMSGVKAAFGLFWCSPRRNSFHSLGADSKRYHVIWFKVCWALIPCLYVIRQYGEGKTCSYSKSLVVLQNARSGLTLPPRQGQWQCFDLCFWSLFVGDIDKYTLENLYLTSCVLKNKVC